MKTCPKCKTTGIPDDANFCPACGEELPIKEYGWKERSLWEKILICFVAVLMIYLIYHGFVYGW